MQQKIVSMDEYRKIKNAARNQANQNIRTIKLYGNYWSHTCHDEVLIQLQRGLVCSRCGLADNNGDLPPCA